MLLKTIETKTDPTIIVTNDGGEDGGLAKGSVLLKVHCFSGEEGEETTRLTMTTDETFYLGQEELKAAIAALSEFLVKDGDT